MCGSAYGASFSTLEALLSIKQRNQPQLIKVAFWIGRVHVTGSGIPKSRAHCGTISMPATPLPFSQPFPLPGA